MQPFAKISSPANVLRPVTAARLLLLALLLLPTLSGLRGKVV